jgi:DNA-binding transcriptional MerR regulator
MINFVFYSNPTLTLACRPAGAHPSYSLDEASYLTGVHSKMLGYYCRLGLLGPQRAGRQGEPVFDDEMLDDVERIEHYRRFLGVNRRALPLICELWREGERRQIELRFLRVP